MPTRLAHHPVLVERLRTPTAADPWRVLVSGCLAGLPCGVDGTDYGMGADPAALLGLPTVRTVPFCPEDHGLGTPRTMPDLHGGDGHAVLDGRAVVRDEHGADLTAGMVAGARAMVACAQDARVDFAVLTDMSAACGTQVVSDGCRYDAPRRYQRGQGVAAAALIRAGVPVVSQRDHATLARLHRRAASEDVQPAGPDHHDHPWMLEHMGPLWETRDCHQAPQLIAEIQALIARSWPRYILHAHTAPDLPRTDWAGIFSRWPHLQIGLHQAGTLVAAANCVPLRWDRPLAELPDQGWDWAMLQAVADLGAGRTPNVAVALCVSIAPAHRGLGLSGRMVKTLRDHARTAGLAPLLVPVRPSWKSRHPLESIDDYLDRPGPDGLPHDPWLRTHVRVGGRILGPCRRSMQLAGSIAEWQDWLGLSLEGSGPHTSPDLLAPLQVDRAGDLAVYVEPNVWVVHGQD